MRWLLVLLTVILVILQFKLWVGRGSLAQAHQFSSQLEQVQQQNLLKQQRNNALHAEVRDLQSGLEAVEERARNELGLIKPEETFYLVIDKDSR